VKSANVVLNEAQTPKLVDFGLSDLLPHASRDLAGAAVGLQGLKGTAAFIAPELVMAATGAAVAESTPQAVDMFGVGVVLHDLGHLGLTAAERSRDEDVASADAIGSGHLGSVQLLTQRLVTGFDVQVRGAQWNGCCVRSSQQALTHRTHRAGWRARAAGSRGAHPRLPVSVSGSAAQRHGGAARAHARNCVKFITPSHIPLNAGPCC